MNIVPVIRRVHGRGFGIWYVDTDTESIDAVHRHTGVQLSRLSDPHSPVIFATAERAKEWLEGGADMNAPEAR